MIQYNPAIFTRVNNLQDAKRIILTDEGNLKTDQRWELETPHICDLMYNTIDINQDSVVLDYGCGVGRIAKELIKRHGCYVVGVDIAPNMQALAVSYVASDRFIVCHPQALFLLGIKVDIAISIWVLQHVENLNKELSRIKAILRIHGHLFVVNERARRFVPTIEGWKNDGLDVSKEIDSYFDKVSEGNLSPSVVGDEQSARTFWKLSSNYFGE